MAKTKYDEVLEQLEIIKKQADNYLYYKGKDSDEQLFTTVFEQLDDINRLFKEKTQPFADAKGESPCPPGTYDCDEYCSATPCFGVTQIPVPPHKN